MRRFLCVVNTKIVNEYNLPPWFGVPLTGAGDLQLNFFCGKFNGRICGNPFKEITSTIAIDLNFKSF